MLPRKYCKFPFWGNATLERGGRGGKNEYTIMEQEKDGHGIAHVFALILSFTLSSAILVIASIIQ
jgi:hypothetical protein